LTLETGSSTSARFGVEAGSLVAKDFIEKASTPFGNTVAHVVTGTDGKYSISPIDPGTYKLDVSKSGSGLASAINVTDAQAALRLAVGGNPNPVGATGTATKISPFQFMAADVNADGKVNVMDAQAILKLAVAANQTFTPEWMFVEDTRVLNLDRKNAAWDHSINVPVTGDTAANLIGVIKGDVNGSWAAPTGSQYVEDLSPGYFSPQAAAMATTAATFVAASATMGVGSSAQTALATPINNPLGTELRYAAAAF
jgi:hypothetical protein